jgi:hypothetical protein
VIYTVPFVLHDTDGNIKMDLKQTGWEGVVSINLTQKKDKWQAV